MHRKEPLRLQAWLLNVLPWQQFSRPRESQSTLSDAKVRPSSFEAPISLTPNTHPDGRVAAVENQSHANLNPPSQDLVELTEVTPSGSALLPRPAQRRWPTQGWPWLIGFAISGLTGASALLWLSRLPSLPNCSINSLAETGSARLYCTQQAVEEGNLGVLVSALEMVSRWPQDDPLATQANYLADEWSRMALVIARQKMRAGDLPGAMKLAQKIPDSTDVYSEARTEIQSWEQDWQQGSQGFEAAQAALKEQNWQLASDQLKRLAQIDSAYWRDRVDRLIEQIATEKQAWATLRRAQDLAATGNLDDLAAAINRAQRVEPDSYARGQAKADIDEWSQELLDIAQTAGEGEDWQTAIAAAKAIPQNTAAFAQAQDLAHFGKAQTLAQQDQLENYLQAWALAQQIPPDRPLHASAQQRVAEWETQIQNLGQLRLAQWFASVDEVLTYQLAIDYAQMVALNQPRHTEAQTLVSQWHNQVETLEDRHFLARARHLAASGTLETLRVAIALASQIDLGRALRLDAQTLIAGWQAQIQRVQDQPILDQAQELARQGQLEAAIQKAEQISPERALYGEAQDYISRWLADIQTAQDRPLLREAIALAAGGSLSEAINLAGQIGYERTLYGEAQDYISRWSAERTALEAARSTPEPPAPEPTADALDIPLDVESFEPPVAEEEPIPPEPEPEPIQTPQEDPSRLAPRNQGPPIQPGSDTE